LTRRIAIFDTTLRDGEQSPGIALQPDEKAEIAEQLERLGADVIEAGFAVSSPGDFEGVRAVAGAVSRSTVASLCRTREEDIDAASEALASARRSRIHVFLATSPVHMEKKLRLEPDEVVEQARWAVGYARGRADEVEFSCEDATRSHPAFVARVCGEAVQAGATTINLPDTVGYCLPTSTRSSSSRSGGCVPSCSTSRCPSTATTTSDWRWRTRSRASVQAPARSSALLTGSASAPATPRSRRS
jgi:2-isopropylmalate synthase